MSVVQRATPLIITPCKARTWSWNFFVFFLIPNDIVYDPAPGEPARQMLRRCRQTRVQLSTFKIVIAFMLYQLSTSRSQSKRGVVGWKNHLAGNPQKSYNQESLSLSDKLHFQQQYKTPHENENHHLSRETLGECPGMLLHPGRSYFCVRALLMIIRRG